MRLETKVLLIHHGVTDWHRDGKLLGRRDVPMNADGHKQAEAEVTDTVMAAQKEAEKHGTLHSGGKPSVRDMFQGVYEEMPPHLRRQRQQAGI